MASNENLTTLFNDSVVKLQNGHIDSAKKGFAKVVKLVPDSPIAWYNLGLAHQHLNEHSKAILVYKEVLKLDSKNIDAWVNLGISYEIVHNLSSAMSCTKKALLINAHYPRALNLKGSILAHKGQFESAKACFEESLCADDRNWDALFNLANANLELGCFSKTELYLNKLKALDPNNKKMLELTAQTFINKKDYNSAAKIIRDLEASYGNDETVLRLSLSLREIANDHFGVIEYSDKLIEHFPHDAKLWNSRGGAYFQLDSIKSAEKSYKRAVSLDPKQHEYLNNLGLVYSSLGDKSNAEKHYRQSLDINPGYGEAHKNLAAMKRFVNMDDPDAKAVERLWKQGGHSTLNTIKLSFALGKIYDDCGLFDQAFEVYQVGNDLKFKESRINLKDYFAHIDRIPEVFTHPPLSTDSEQGSFTPIFVLGMPRSGTTLVEQIISRHPLVTGCGELPCIEKTINHLESQVDTVCIYPDDFIDIPSDILSQESIEYLNWVKQIHQINTPFIIDKMPFNFVHIWLINAIFPESPIVNCQRHPLDVILSNYFQLFGSDVSFVYNLDALADYYVRYHNLMQHWLKLFGSKITNIRYEWLVSDNEHQVKQLINSLGLPWDEACLQQKNKDSRAVRTASIWQVRQGIYTRSKERWRNYKAQLQPIVEKLLDHDILDSKMNHKI